VAALAVHCTTGAPASRVVQLITIRLRAGRARAPRPQRVPVPQRCLCQARPCSGLAVVQTAAC